ncbi:MAG TPA: CHAD domain-containing protein [Acidimicrobiales bacterium]|nr:CHAD domain-containing protein [Acidimicrobiales bacterium]
MPARVDDLARAFLARGVGTLLRLDRDVRRGRDVEAVHQMRVTVRHLRSELRVIERALRSRRVEALDRDLRWLGRSLGRLRDTDVLGALLADPALPRSRAVDERLAAERAAEARDVARALSSDRYRRLVESLASAALRPPLRARGPRDALAVLAPGLTREIARLEAAAGALGDAPALEELHALRILGKRCRYTCELAISIVPGTKRAASDLERLQGALGDLHDHSVARAFVRSCAPRLSLFEPSEPDHEVEALDAALAEGAGDLLTRWREPLERARASLAGVAAGLQTSSSPPEVPVE